MTESTAADLTGVKSPTFEYEAAQAVKAMLDGLDGLTPDKKAAVAMVAAVLLVGDMPGITAKRGKVVNVMTAEFRRMLQSYLP